mmetsp:Transcript_134721/g.300217  ORF Transcript_134721/g.300217 Transcript_134721/m.300217 type:complete len:328 (+) Transcript_134721:41-1024(+)
MCQTATTCTCAAMRIAVALGMGAAGASPACGLRQAQHPTLDALERMEGCGPSICAIRACAHIVAEHLCVENSCHAQQVHAMRHEIILAPCLPRELRSTSRTPRCISSHRTQREDLSGPIHHGEVGRVREGVAVDHIDVGPSMRRHVLPQAVGHQYCIRIDLHSPIIVPETVVLYDFVPGRHEKLCICRRPVLRDAHLDLRYFQCYKRTLLARRPAIWWLAERDHVVSKDHVTIASKNPNALLQLRSHKAQLIALGPHDRIAEEGRGSSKRKAKARRAQCRAVPSLVLTREGRRAATISALRPILALLEALRAYLDAALRFAAIIGLS